MFLLFENRKHVNNGIQYYLLFILAFIILFQMHNFFNKMRENETCHLSPINKLKTYLECLMNKTV